MFSLKSSIETALGRLISRTGVRSIVFEATRECNQDCAFCYNVWKCADYPGGSLGTAGTLRLLDRAIGDYRPRIVTFSGGEPLLRDDLVELIHHVGKRASCNVITNGTLMSDALAKELVRAGVRTFEFTLLSADREVHNSLVQRDSFDQLVEAIACVQAAGGSVATTFVATKENIGTLAETIELNVALGVGWMLFNRFNVGGSGIARASELMPSVEQLQAALAVADESSRRYGITISCGVPIPPCVMDLSPYKSIHFVDCAIGTRNAYPTIDPVGNVRWCNHSPRILGNALEQSVGDILRGEAAKNCIGRLPSECEGCEHASKCRGGCRAASDVWGGPCGIDPFVHLCRSSREPSATRRTGD